MHLTHYSNKLYNLNIPKTVPIIGTYNRGMRRGTEHKTCSISVHQNRSGNLESLKLFLSSTLIYYDSSVVYYEVSFE